MKPETIYVAGRLTDKNPGKVLVNGGELIRAGIEVMKKGHYPYVPSMDYQIYMQMKNDEFESLGDEYYYDFSLNWLDKCDSMVIINGLDDSKGVKMEHEFAKSKGKKIYYDIKDIQEVIK